MRVLELVTRLDELEHGDDPKGSGERPWSESLLYGVLGLVVGMAIGRFALPEGASRSAHACTPGE